MLGVAHILVGLPSLVPAVFAGVWAAPVVLGPVWYCALGLWLWRPGPGLRPALLVTHSIVAVFAVLNIGFGVAALKAAERSAAKGGGLMGGIGLLPIAYGAALLLLAAVSFWTAFALRAEEKASTISPAA